MILLWPVLIGGKVVLITGASRGIGMACAHAFRSRGALLSLTARTGCDVPDALTTEGDITHPATRMNVIGRTLERYGRIDIVINNAGLGAYGPTWEANDEATRRMFDLNFFAPLALAQLAIPYMLGQKSGVIVNIASLAGKVSLPWMTLYSASKGALLSLTDGLRRELQGTGVHTMAVCPGYVKTEFHGHALGKPPARVTGLMKYAITPENCAEAIVRGVERDARLVVAPWWGWPFIVLDRILPAAIDSRLSSVLSGNGR